MGSYISLGIGELELDWGKNYHFRDYSSLYLPTDRKLIPYYYADDEVVNKMGYSKPLREVKSRLELLGYSLNNLKKIFTEHEAEYPDYLDQPDIEFETLLRVFSKVDVKEYKNKDDGYDDYDLGEYVRLNIFQNESFKDLAEELDIQSNDIGSYFENLDPLFIIRLLIENPDNLDLNLEWRTQDVIDGGWISEEDVYNPTLDERAKFLIVTEGNTDTFVIKKSLDLLRPDIADFFSFVDMKENYPFTGTGNLYNFCQGLASIRIQNKVLVIFDNDVEGVLTFDKVLQLDLPDNMRVMKLPDLDSCRDFLTVGPSGETHEDINGKAVAIESFLDWSNFSPRVRWVTYKKQYDLYQGAIEGKDGLVRAFKKVNESNRHEYDFSELNLLLDAIYQKCI